jgi:hypothetical protein
MMGSKKRALRFDYTEGYVKCQSPEADNWLREDCQGIG